MSSTPHQSEMHRARRHLEVAKTGPSIASIVRRWVVVAGALAAVGCFIASLSQPWWELKLYAPQYPHGLHIVISLTGVSGDVGEINELNHYIGMGHLDDAARVERRMAGFGIAAVSLMVVAFTLIMGRKLGWLMIIPGALFPLGFLADSFYWMSKYGHGLDPHAPLHIPPFTPQLFGNGAIGQFMTFASPELGFWLAVAGVVLLAVAALLRTKVCATCQLAGTCGTVCKNAFITPAAMRASGNGGH